MTPPEMPTKLLVIGSGAIGIEFASFYNDMGAEVTVVEMLDRIVPVEDADVSAFLEKALTKQGMTILTGAGVEELEGRRQGRVRRRSRARTARSSQPSSAMCIVAIGIVPNTENIGLEELGVEDRPRPSSRPIGYVPHQCRRASGRSAIVTAPARGWRTRRATKASPPPRRSPRSWATRTSTRTRWTATTSRAAPIATRRSPASA